MNFAARGVRTNITFTNQGKRKRMIENRNVNIITDADGKKLILINDIRFKGRRQIDWDDVKLYLKGYVGDYYEIEENAATAIPELIQIASNPSYEENILVRYNIFYARLLVNHAENDKKYLYDILAVKKETSKP